MEVVILHPNTSGVNHRFTENCQALAAATGVKATVTYLGLSFRFFDNCKHYQVVATGEPEKVEQFRKLLPKIGAEMD